MSKLIVAALAFACIAVGASEAAAGNNESVTGGFTSRFERFGQGQVLTRVVTEDLFGAKTPVVRKPDVNQAQRQADEKSRSNN